MMRKQLLLILSVLFQAPIACVTSSSQDAVHSASHWGNWQEKRLEDRLASASPEMIAFIADDNAKNNFPNHPSKPNPDPGLWRDIRQAVQDLPKPLQKKLEKKLTGIALISDLGGTGFTDIVRDAQGHPVAGFILLDVHAIDRQANDWATWKENTPFIPARGYELRAVIEPEASNTRLETIQYILLHEAAHVLSIGESFHPSWDEAPAQGFSLQKHPFAALGWTVDAKESRYIPSARANVSTCPGIHYYLKPEAPVAQAQTCYQALQQGPFVNLYASTNPFDDFAETLVFYVHHVLQKKPWRIELKMPAGTFIYEPSWDEPRFNDKRRIIEALFN